MNYSEALQKVKQGHAAARHGWNGKNMFIFMMPNQEFTVKKGHVLGNLMPVDTIMVEERHIAMWTADNSIVPWLCSQKDALADDWTIAHFNRYDEEEDRPAFKPYVHGQNTEQFE